jgi:hypothetical protein
VQVKKDIINRILKVVTIRIIIIIQQTVNLMDCWEEEVSGNADCLLNCTVVFTMPVMHSYTIRSIDTRVIKTLQCRGIIKHKKSKLTSHTYYGL